MSQPSYPEKRPESPFASFAGHHVAVRVADYDQAMDWYTQKLDFRLLSEWEWAGLRFAYLLPPNDDGFHFEIMGGGPSPRPRPGYADVEESLREAGYHHFCLRVADLDQALAELRRRGVPVLGEPFDLPEAGARLVVLADPWGNQIELSQPLP